MNPLEHLYFQKECDNELRRQLIDIQKKYEELKSFEGLTQYFSEETQKLFKKILIYYISLSSEEIQLNSKELKETQEQLQEKEEANKKILLKLLDFKAFLDSYP